MENRRTPPYTLHRSIDIAKSFADSGLAEGGNDILPSTAALIAAARTEGRLAASSRKPPLFQFVYRSDDRHGAQG